MLAPSSWLAVALSCVLAMEFLDTTMEFPETAMKLLETIMEFWETATEIPEAATEFLEIALEFGETAPSSRLPVSESCALTTASPEIDGQLY